MGLKTGLSLVCILMIGACAPAQVRWQHNDIPKEQWRSDLNRCNRAVERHLGLDESLHQTGPAQASSYEDQMRLYRLQKSEKRLVADCMKKLGYQPAD